MLPSVIFLFKLVLFYSETDIFLNEKKIDAIIFLTKQLSQTGSNKVISQAEYSWFEF